MKNKFPIYEQPVSLSGKAGPYMNDELVPYFFWGTNDEDYTVQYVSNQFPVYGEPDLCIWGNSSIFTYILYSISYELVP
jgi:hypothetical protein